MKFLRLTSVLLCCALLSSFLILPVSAVDDDNYYSFPPVGGAEPSVAVDLPVNPAEFSNDDSRTLTRIYEIIQYLYLSPSSWQSNSVIGFLEKIYDRLPSNLGTNFALQSGAGTNSILDDIRKWTMFSYNYLSSDNIAGNLGNIQRNTLSSADSLHSLVNAFSGIDGYATENTLSSFSSAFASFFGIWKYNYDDYTWPVSVSPDGTEVKTNWKTYYLNMLRNLTYDTGLYSDSLTLRGMVRRLQETLASDADRQLAENYKENREQAEKDFLSGQSGKTSLGKDDFGSLSSVGGTFKDTISLNGQSSLSDLTSGLADADTAGQGWFSQATKDSLDAVSGSLDSTVSTFSDDGLCSVDVDPDPYHMQGFEDNYSWLWGDS